MAARNGEQRDPVLELVIVHSTKYPEKLSLRCADDLVDGGQVMARLNIAGFKAGDRVELRRVRPAAPPPTAELVERRLEDEIGPSGHTDRCMWVREGGPCTCLPREPRSKG